MKILLSIILLILPTTSLAERVLFLHRSTGANILSQGSVRELLRDDIDLWNQNANSPYYLFNQDGFVVSWNYGITGTDISDNDLYDLWTTDNVSRDSLLTYDVVVFKSCYDYNASITSDEMLESYKSKYMDILSTLSGYDNKKFIVMGYPPIRENFPVYGYTYECAQRSVEFNNWLMNQCGGNIYCFPLFEHLADENGFLRSEYCMESPNDTHANQLANQILGPLLTQAIESAIMDVSAVFDEEEQTSFGNIKATYR